MKSFVCLGLWMLTWTFFSCSGAKPEKSGDNTWLVLPVEDAIGVMTTYKLEKALERAAESDMQGIILKIDTPGGLLSSTRDTVKLMLNSSLPIISWVGPEGSQAASAGAFITLAAHIAVMAPSTNIGAATPIQATGQNADPEKSSDLNKKILQDTTALMESIAARRGRNVELAKGFVLSATSITADDAAEENVIDFMAPNIASIFEKLDGQQIELGEQTYKFSKDGIVLEHYEETLIQKIMSIFSDPNIFYLLFLGGLLGIGYEIMNPGFMFPGVFGAICLVLAWICTAAIPVHFGGAALIVLGIGFMVAEIFVPSFGVLGIGGFSSFVFGSFLLIDSQDPSMQISLSAMIPVILFVGIFFLTIGYLIIKSERRPPQGGTNSMIGKKAEVIEDFHYQVADRPCVGKVRIDGEIWMAELVGEGPPPQRGSLVAIRDVDGLRLKVIC